MANVLLLTSDETYYSSERLAEAFQARGHEVALRDPARPGPDPLPEPPGLVVPRLGTQNFASSILYLETLVREGWTPANPPEGVRTCRRKSSVLLGALPAGIRPVPTRLLPKDVPDLDLPVVAKPDMGTQGIGCALFQDHASLAAYGRTAAALGLDLVIQPFLKEARDIRVVVVGGRAAASITRIPAAGDWRANLHRGATAGGLDPDGPWERDAVALANRLGLFLAGVDFLEHGDALFLCEVNASPGLRGVEGATGLDLAGIIADAAQERFGL